MKLLGLLGAMLFLLPPAANAVAQGPVLTGEMAAVKIVVDAEKGELAQVADKVYPKDTLEYTVSYVNSGSAPASGVGLLGPVPEGTEFIDASASDTERLHPLYSIDGGKTWHEAPVMIEVVRKDGGVELRKADPSMITHIKWSLIDQLEVGERVAVSYRVRVK